MADNNNKNANVSTPGGILAAERNKRKLDTRETADALKISVSRLRSIEADDYSVFPSETYVRGHLRNYCRFLKLDEQQILTLYKETQADDEPDDVTGLESVSPSASNGQKRWWIVYFVLIVFVLLWALSYWLLGAKKEAALSEIQTLPDVLSSERRVDTPLSDPVRPSLEQNNPTAGTVIATGIENETVSNESADSAGSGSDETLPVVVDAFSPTDAPAANENEQDKTIIVSKLTAAELVKSIQSQEAPAVLEPQQVVPEGDTLQFVFDDASWIQVVDSTGAVLFKGLNKSGAELDLNGKAPFNIIIGNVAGTSLVYNGENVELVAPRGKNTLRLNLGG